MGFSHTCGFVCGRYRTRTSTEQKENSHLVKQHEGDRLFNPHEGHHLVADANPVIVARLQRFNGDSLNCDALSWSK